MKLRAMSATGAIGAMGAVLVLCASSAFAQVGKSLGVVDANTATEQVLVAAPSVSAPVVKALIAARPFNSIVDLNKFLLSHRPWKSIEHFHKEIGKYVDDKEVRRLARYVAIQ